MTPNENTAAPTHVRVLAVAVLGLIALAIFTPSWDWGAGVEGRLTGNSLGAFFENDRGDHLNPNYRKEHTDSLKLGFELRLFEPAHAMLAWLSVDGDADTRRLYPLDAETSPSFDAGRHVLPTRLGLSDRRTESFVVAVYSPDAIDWPTFERALARVERPLTREALQGCRVPGEIHSVHLPVLDEVGRAR